MAGNIEAIQGLDVADIVNLVGRKSKRFQAILLQDVEEIVNKDSPEYKRLRKLLLDTFNDYTRSIVRAIFGDDFEL